MSWLCFQRPVAISAKKFIVLVCLLRNEVVEAQVPNCSSKTKHRGARMDEDSGQPQPRHRILPPPPRALGQLQKGYMTHGQSDRKETPDAGRTRRYPSTFVQTIVESGLFFRVVDDLDSNKRDQGFCRRRQPAALGTDKENCLFGPEVAQGNKPGGVFLTRLYLILWRELRIGGGKNVDFPAPLVPPHLPKQAIHGSKQGDPRA